MTTNSRRIFLIATAATGATLATGARAQAQAQKVDEKEPQAVAVGYVHDATKVDTKKFPKYQAGQICANCQLYQGKASDPWAGCGIFGGRQVAAKGWCNAWVKKAGA